MALHIAALYAGINALFNVALAANVSRVRGKVSTFIGDGGHEQLTLAMRVHGNNAEYLPLALVLLVVAEGVLIPALWLHVFAGAFTLGRVVHAFGLSNKIIPARIGGILLTWASIAALAISAIYGACTG